MGVCKAVTCASRGRPCTVRGSSSLGTSSSGETTYVPASTCFQAATPPPTKAPTPAPTQACSGSEHTGKYSGGYAGRVSARFSNMKDAKSKCVELGMGVCKAVTCASRGRPCTVRGSSSLGTSSSGETTYVPASTCFQAATPPPTKAPTPAPTQACSWSEHTGKYSGGYAGCVSTRFSNMKDAKSKCVEL